MNDVVVVELPGQSQIVDALRRWSEVELTIVFLLQVGDDGRRSVILEPWMLDLSLWDLSLTLLKIVHLFILLLNILSVLFRYFIFIEAKPLKVRRMVCGINLVSFQNDTEIVITQLFTVLSISKLDTCNSSSHNAVLLKLG